MASPSAHSRARVLLIDRDPRLLDDRVDAFLQAGFDPSGCTGAAEALTAAFALPPAIAIIDLTSGDLDGFALALELRGDHRTHHIPIIGMISAWSPDVRARAARAGICILLLEPCVHEHLLAEVGRALRPFRPPAHATVRALNR